MRQNTLTYAATKTATVDYPEQAAWKRDRNIVKVVLSDTTDKVAVQVDITDTVGTYSLAYSSSFSWLVVDITDLLRLVVDITDTSATIDITVTATDTVGTDYTVAFSDAIFVHDGRTVGGRRHGANNVVRYYDYFPNIEYYDGLTIDTYDTTTGTPAADGRIYIQWTSGGEYLDAINRRLISGHEQMIALKKVCEPANVVWLRYRNTDGSLRYVGANPLTIADTSEGVKFADDDLTVNRVVELKTGVTRAITLGVEDVEYGEYLTDIAIADLVEFSFEDGDWWPCVVGKVDYVQDGGTHNMKIEIIVNN